MQMVPVPQRIPSTQGVGREAAECVTKLTIPQRERRRALIAPREHGAWGMLVVPLLTGAAVGLLAGGRVGPVLLLTTAVITLFWMRTPLESWLGASPVRVQTTEEHRLVLSVMLPLAAIMAVNVTVLFSQGKNRGLIWLGLISGVAFATQMFLKRMRTTRMAAEVVGALALTLTAPAAYYVSTGRLDARAWALWLVNWLFAAGQIQFVWLTIRGARATGFSEKFTLGWRFLAAQVLLGVILTLACELGWLPKLTLLAFVPVLFRGLLWFAKRPQPIVIRRLGWTELVHAVAFGILLTASFCLVS